MKWRVQMQTKPKPTPQQDPPNNGAQPSTNAWRHRLLILCVACLHSLPIVGQQRLEPPSTKRSETKDAPTASPWQLPHTAALQPTDPSHSTAMQSAAQPTWLSIYRDQSTVVAAVANPLFGPVDVQLKNVSPLTMTAIPPLPIHAHLAAREQRILTRLYSSEQPLPAIELSLTVVPGTPNDSLMLHRTVLYNLPFHGPTIHISQQFNGRATHHNLANRYALDFALPEGTPILASRDGIVMDVHSDVLRSHQHVDGAGNYVLILHSDGTMVIYAHLQPNRAMVTPGETIKTAQVIGYSGQSGWSSGPHLHFAVLVNDLGRLRAIPFRMVTPRGELKFPTQLSTESPTRHPDDSSPLTSPTNYPATLK